VRRILDEHADLDLFQEVVTDVVVEDGRVAGVRARSGLVFEARALRTYLYFYNCNFQHL
jgi:tRNA U34 5-carboxymethylaminomethyl modifying enzyme MnmG/GidA